MTKMGMDLVVHIILLLWKLCMPPARRLRAACPPYSARFPRLGHSPDRGLTAAHLCALCAAPARRIRRSDAQWSHWLMEYGWAHRCACEMGACGERRPAAGSLHARDACMHAARIRVSDDVS